MLIVCLQTAASSRILLVKKELFLPSKHLVLYVTSLYIVNVEITCALILQLTVALKKSNCHSNNNNNQNE